jgi:hypothetical protein
MLDRNICISDDKFTKVDEYKNKLFVISAWVAAFCLFVGIAYWRIWNGPLDWPFIALGYLDIITVSAFLIIWGCTLLRLNRQVKNSRGLLPNKTIFLFHGLTISVGLVFSLLMETFYTLSVYYDSQNLEAWAVICATL